MLLIFRVAKVISMHFTKYIILPTFCQWQTFTIFEFRVSLINQTGCDSRVFLYRCVRVNFGNIAIPIVAINLVSNGFNFHILLHCYFISLKCKLIRCILELLRGIFTKKIKKYTHWCSNTDSWNIRFILKHSYLTKFNLKLRRLNTARCC